MSALISQLPANLTDGLAGAGVLGTIIAILFIRDFVRDKRDFQREEVRETARNEREKSRDAQMDKLTGAVSNLVRITSLEVLTRPSVSERMQEEVRELHRSATPGERA